MHSNIHDAYRPDCKFMVVAALFGSATALLLYRITRNFGGSAYGSACTSRCCRTRATATPSCASSSSARS
jgi:hypothetical protein